MRSLDIGIEDSRACGRTASREVISFPVEVTSSMELLIAIQNMKETYADGHPV